MDQDGEVVDAFIQERRNSAVVKRFLKQLLKVHHKEPRIVSLTCEKLWCCASGVDT
ncbi:MAG: DDE-type integrase/transposase/recombinase [Granulosicoccus sp.]